MKLVSIEDHEYETRVDISSEEFWGKPYRERDVAFAWLRHNAPISWHPPLDSYGYPNAEKGFWAVTLADDIREVSQDHESFSSATTVSARPVAPPLAPTMILSDPPEHERYRMMISSAFTPKAVNRLSEKIKERAEQIVDRVRGAGEIDFVKEVSSKLPMLTVADLFGVPESLVDDFTLAGDRWASAQDPAVRPAGVTVPEFMMTQVDILQKIGVEVVHHRRAHPADDLATALGRATMGGRTLDDSEIGTVVLLLSVAGNDTTKQTTGWAMHQLWTHPDQKQLLADDYDGMIAGAIEEFIRHTSPVQRFARTAKKDVTLGDVEIKKYDKVLMLYASGNRDETVFDDPWRFDITRGRTPHVGFGGGGVHYCLGNAVAKAQLRALFQQFLTKLWDMEVGEPEFLRSDSFNGFRTFPVRIP